MPRDAISARDQPAPGQSSSPPITAPPTWVARELLVGRRPGAVKPHPASDAERRTTCPFDWYSLHMRTRAVSSSPLRSIPTAPARKVVHPVSVKVAASAPPMTNAPRKLTLTALIRQRSHWKAILTTVLHSCRCQRCSDTSQPGGQPGGQTRERTSATRAPPMPLAGSAHRQQADGGITDTWLGATRDAGAGIFGNKEDNHTGRGVGRWLDRLPAFPAGLHTESWRRDPDRVLRRSRARSGGTACSAGPRRPHRRALAHHRAAHHGGGRSLAERMVLAGDARDPLHLEQRARRRARPASRDRVRARALRRTPARGQRSPPWIPLPSPASTRDWRMPVPFLSGRTRPARSRTATWSSAGCASLVEQGPGIARTVLPVARELPMEIR